MKRSILYVLITLAAIGCSARSSQPSPSQSAQPGVLVFSKTSGFRHEDAINAGGAAIRQMASASGFAVEMSEDATNFTRARLARFRVIVFLNTTGDVLNEEQQSAFEEFIRQGGGYVGIHSATDTEYDWPWYGGLVGAYFKSHPNIQTATIIVQDPNHPSTSHLPERWVRTDEWYNFHTNPRSSVHILAAIDESTYQGGDLGPDHPIAWCHQYVGGRSWYTAGGHSKDAYSEPFFLDHVLGGVLWSAGMEGGSCA